MRVHDLIKKAGARRALQKIAAGKKPIYTMEDAERAGLDWDSEVSQWLEQLRQSHPENYGKMSDEELRPRAERVLKLRGPVGPRKAEQVFKPKEVKERRKIYSSKKERKARTEMGVREIQLKELEAAYGALRKGSSIPLMAWVQKYSEDNKRRPAGSAVAEEVLPPSVIKALPTVQLKGASFLRTIGSFIGMDPQKGAREFGPGEYTTPPQYQPQFGDYFRSKDHPALAYLFTDADLLPANVGDLVDLGTGHIREKFLVGKTGQGHLGILRGIPAGPVLQGLGEQSQRFVHDYLLWGLKEAPEHNRDVPGIRAKILGEADPVTQSLQSFVESKLGGVANVVGGLQTRATLRDIPSDRKMELIRRDPGSWSPAYRQYAENLYKAGKEIEAATGMPAKKLAPVLDSIEGEYLRPGEQSRLPKDLRARMESPEYAPMFMAAAPTQTAAHGYYTHLIDRRNEGLTRPGEVTGLTPREELGYLLGRFMSTERKYAEATRQGWFTPGGRPEIITEGGEFRGTKRERDIQRKLLKDRNDLLNQLGRARITTDDLRAVGVPEDQLSSTARNLAVLKTTLPAQRPQVGGELAYPTYKENAAAVGLGHVFGIGSRYRRLRDVFSYREKMMRPPKQHVPFQEEWVFPKDDIDAATEEISELSGVRVPPVYTRSQHRAQEGTVFGATTPTEEGTRLRGPWTPEDIEDFQRAPLPGMPGGAPSDQETTTPGEAPVPELRRRGIEPAPAPGPRAVAPTPEQRQMGAAALAPFIRVPGAGFIPGPGALMGAPGPTAKTDVIPTPGGTMRRPREEEVPPGREPPPAVGAPPTAAPEPAAAREVEIAPRVAPVPERGQAAREMLETPPEPPGERWREELPPLTRAQARGRPETTRPSHLLAKARTRREGEKPDQPIMFTREPEGYQYVVPESRLKRPKGWARMPEKQRAEIRGRVRKVPFQKNVNAQFFAALSQSGHKDYAQDVHALTKNWWHKMDADQRKELGKSISSKTVDVAALGLNEQNAQRAAKYLPQGWTLRLGKKEFKGGATIKGPQLYAEGAKPPKPKAPRPTVPTAARETLPIAAAAEGPPEAEPVAVPTTEARGPITGAMAAIRQRLAQMRSLKQSASPPTPRAG